MFVFLFCGSCVLIFVFENRYQVLKILIRKEFSIVFHNTDTSGFLITIFLMYFQFCMAFLRVQFLGLYTSQCTFILLLMLSMTTNFFIMYMLMAPNCIALLLPIKLIHYLTKFLHQPMTSTYGCQQTN